VLGERGTVLSGLDRDLIPQRVRRRQGSRPAGLAYFLKGTFLFCWWTRRKFLGCSEDGLAALDLVSAPRS
jgi:hypothetical protein